MAENINVSKAKLIKDKKNHSVIGSEVTCTAGRGGKTIVRFDWKENGGLLGFDGVGEVWSHFLGFNISKACLVFRKKVLSDDIRVGRRVFGEEMVEDIGFITEGKQSFMECMEDEKLFDKMDPAFKPVLESARKKTLEMLKNEGRTPSYRISFYDDDYS